MRYPIKGKCKPKGETRVSWSVTGPTGAQGPPGPTGSKGESETRALLLDASGKDLGHWFASGSDIFRIIDKDGGIWLVRGSIYQAEGDSTFETFSDPDCSKPLFLANKEGQLPPPSTRWTLSLPGFSPARSFRASGLPAFHGKQLPAVYVYRSLDNQEANMRCYDSSLFSAGMKDNYFWNAVEVTPPSYQPPLTVSFSSSN